MRSLLFAVAHTTTPKAIIRQFRSHMYHDPSGNTAKNSLNVIHAKKIKTTTIFASARGNFRSFEASHAITVTTATSRFTRKVLDTTPYTSWFGCISATQAQVSTPTKG